MPKGKRFSGQFKIEVALEAAKGAKTLAELASEFGLHPSQISEWKGHLMAEGVNLFASMTAQQRREQESLQTDLYEQIGRLQMELEFLKKKAAQ